MATDMTPTLEARHITKIYGEDDKKVVAVDDVTLALHAGEVLLIMGPSGSGKTTLLSMMGCILRPTHGQLFVSGQEVSTLHETQLPKIRRQHMGFVFQAFNLFPALTAVENVEVILRLKGYDRSTMRSKASALLSSVGLSKRAHAYPMDLSGGEKQRTAFARALAGDPPILLADEPTGNLDSRTGMEVLRLLRDLACDLSKSIAIVSHDPKAEALAHRVVFLEDGRLKQ